MTTLAITAFAALLVIWVVYPLVIAAIAALRSPPRRITSGDDPLVSIIIASRDSASAIQQRVRDVLAAAYTPDRLQVVVALDHPATAAVRSALTGLDPRVVLVDAPPPGGKAAGLNAAVGAATGELLVFTDTHQRFDLEAIAELVASLRDERFGVVSGALELGTRPDGPTLGDRYWRYERWLRANEARVHSTVGATGAIYAMRRTLWSPLPAGLILDDVYTPMQAVLAGARVGFTTRAQATDLRRFDAAQEYRRKARTLTGVLQLCAWLPDVLVPVRNPIWVQFLFHKLLRLLTPYLLLMMVIGVVGAVVPLLVREPWLLLVAAIPLLGALGLPAIRRRVYAQLRWGLALQAAIITATVNGVRGRWNVWQ